MSTLLRVDNPNFLINYRLSTWKLKTYTESCTLPKICTHVYIHSLLPSNRRKPRLEGHDFSLHKNKNNNKNNNKKLVFSLSSLWKPSFRSTNENTFIFACETADIFLKTMSHSQNCLEENARKTMLSSPLWVKFIYTPPPSFWSKYSSTEFLQ